jgi:hypothetical protein
VLAEFVSAIAPCDDLRVSLLLAAEFLLHAKSADPVCDFLVRVSRASLQSGDSSLRIFSIFQRNFPMTPTSFSLRYLQLLSLFSSATATLLRT